MDYNKAIEEFEKMHADVYDANGYDPYPDDIKVFGFFRDIKLLINVHYADDVRGFKKDFIKQLNYIYRTTQSYTNNSKLDDLERFLQDIIKDLKKLEGTTQTVHKTIRSRVRTGHLEPSPHGNVTIQPSGIYWLKHLKEIVIGILVTVLGGLILSFIL
jgi:hypothetical protein